MFGFTKTNSARMINDMFCQLVGPDFTADFWKQFKDTYITRQDIEFIASSGAGFRFIINCLPMRIIWGFLSVRMVSPV